MKKMLRERFPARHCLSRIFSAKSVMLLVMISLAAFQMQAGALANNLSSSGILQTAPLAVTSQAEQKALPTNFSQPGLPIQGARVQSAFTVKGMVTSEDGESMPGVNILEKGTSNGTTTDAEGKYSLSITAGDAILVFSFIGFVTQEIAVDNRTLIDINLMPDIQSLEEVVVVGYGEQKKVNLTGSVAAVSNEDLTAVPVANTTTALAGKLPGLIAVQRSA